MSFTGNRRIPRHVAEIVRQAEQHRGSRRTARIHENDSRSPEEIPGKERIRGRLSFNRYPFIGKS